MHIYLAQTASLSSEGDGYVCALREVGFTQTLFSFHYSKGAATLPISNENLRSKQHGRELDEHGVRAQPAGGRDA